MMPASISSSQTTRPNSVGLPSLPRPMIAVCGSNMLASFSPAGTCCPCTTRRWVWAFTCLFSQGHLNHLGLLDHLAGQIDQQTILLVQRICGCFPTPPRGVDQSF